jgi:large subunit ribosomal protein L21
MELNKKIAVINTGGKQYVVHEGEKLNVELLEGAEPGAEVAFDQVLLVHADGQTQVGNPTIAGMSVTAKVEGKVRGEKIIVMHKTRRKGYQKATGHRQNYHTVTIGAIGGAAEAKAPKKSAAKSRAKAAEGDKE